MLREREPVSEAKYLEVFDTRNVLDSKEWSVDMASLRAREVLRSLGGAKVVILGQLVAATLRLRGHVSWHTWQTTDRFKYVVVPHPSGLNRVYNDPAMRVATGDLLLSLVKEYERSK